MCIHILVGTDWRLHCYADEALILTAVQLPENCLAERRAACAFQLTGATVAAVRVKWQVMFERRVWQQGSLRVNTVPNQPADIAFEFSAPPVVAGVIAGGKLQLQLANEEETELTTKEFPLWVFHANPFATEFAWLKELQVRIIDPDQKLTGYLKDLEFPGQVRLGKHTHNRILIVAPSKAWDAGIAQQINQALRDGQRVLCLAAAGGQLTLRKLSSAADKHELPEVHTANASFVRQVDPRLSPAALSAIGRYRLGSEHDDNKVGLDRPFYDQISLVINNSGPGWCFLEYGFDAPPARLMGNQETFTTPKFRMRPQLIYCGLDLTSRWHESPSPRYLLAGLLDRLCFEPEITSTEKDMP